MEGKISILVGISGSGKSTWAHQKWKENPLDTVIISRDKIRELLFGFSEKEIKQYWNNPHLATLEKMVTKYEDTLIDESLKSGKHVIMDATHLGLQYLERFKYWNVPTEIIDFHLPVSKAIENDRKRVKQVGDVFIKKQFEQLEFLINHPKLRELSFEATTIKQNKSLPSCVIFDLEGTIAVRGERGQYDWKRIKEDKLDYNTSEILRDLLESENPAIIICTGRDGITEFETRRWLNDKDIKFDGLFIRREGDLRPNWIVKEEMWRKIAEHYYINGIFDNSSKVVRRAKALGLKTFQV